jgi:hypothetical protein
MMNTAIAGPDRRRHLYQRHRAAAAYRNLGAVKRRDHVTFHRFSDINEQPPSCLLIGPLGACDRTADLLSRAARLVLPAGDGHRGFRMKHHRERLVSVGVECVARKRTLGTKKAKAARPWMVPQECGQIAGP